MGQDLPLQGAAVVLDQVIVIWYTFEQGVEIAIAPFAGHGKASQFWHAPGRIRMSDAGIRGCNSCSNGGTICSSRASSTATLSPAANGATNAAASIQAAALLFVQAGSRGPITCGFVQRSWSVSRVLDCQRRLGALFWSPWSRFRPPRVLKVVWKFGELGRGSSAAAVLYAEMAEAQVALAQSLDCRLTHGGFSGLACSGLYFSSVTVALLRFGRDRSFRFVVETNAGGHRVAQSICGVLCRREYRREETRAPRSWRETVLRSWRQGWKCDIC